MTDKEEKELAGLEKENMKTIEEVYNKVKTDKEVREWIEKVKAHKWVKVIEVENV